MRILGDIFYAVIFVSAMGGVFCVFSLLISRILGCALPLWCSLCGMLLFCFPFLSPDVFLIPPERQAWLKGFYTACRIWAFGCGAFFIWDAVRSVLARHALKGYPVCTNERINGICAHCGQVMGLKKMPVLYRGTLEDPVCVTGAFRPAILINETVIEKLTDTELSAVFFHELTHIRRRHILLARIYDYICIVNWPNPFAWIAKEEFSLHCETDCDDNALKAVRGTLTETEYTSAMVRLLELSATQGAKSGRGAGALSFLLTKRRMKRITAKAPKAREKIAAIMLIASLVLTLMLSIQCSRQHFYPYPAYYTGTEYSAGHST